MSAPELELEAWSDPEWEAELEPTVERIRMALAEAGYPDADVYVDPTGIMTDGAPDHLVDRAHDLVNEYDARQARR